MNGVKVELKWGTPPRRSGPGERTRALLAVLEELDKRPGDWAELATFDTPHGANNARRNLAKGRPYVSEQYELRTYKRGRASVLWGRRKGQT